MQVFLVVLIDVLVVVFSVFAVRAAATAFDAGPGVRRGLGFAALLALVWAFAWGHAPVLAELRYTERWALPFSVLSVIIGFAVARAIAGLKVVKRRPLLALAPWRAIFGGLLIAAGLFGGLPAGFFWSAGIGDIAVGLFGSALLLRAGEPGDGVWLAWNIAGFADLLHVLVLAAVFVQPFTVANPGLEFSALLPAAGVPMFVALHVTALLSMRRAKGQTATA